MEEENNINISNVEECEYTTAFFNSLLNNTRFQDLFKIAFPFTDFGDCIPSIKNHYRPINLLRILNDLLVLGESEYSFNSVLYRCLKTEYDNAKEEALEKVYGKGKSI